MRDKRFVAAHCGGTLDLARHRFLAAWAADCAKRVLPLFEGCSTDDRPRRAIEIAHAGSRGEGSVGDAPKAAVAAHAAAREAPNKAATEAARAAGHAVATAHMADHCLGAPLYACKAVQSAGASPEVERAWQLKRVPKKMQPFIVSAFAEFNRRWQRRGKTNKAKSTESQGS